MSNLLDKASIILTPTAYNNGEALCVKPSDGSGDFDFSRNSAATRVNAQGLVENVQILSSNLVQNGDFSEEGVQEVSNGSFSQEGVELITNGNFENGSTGWGFIGAGWTFVGGKATHTGVQSILGQSNILTIGKSYKITFDLSGADNSNYARLLSSQYPNGGNYTSDGTITVYTSTNIDDFLVYAVGDISIDNVSVREVGQDWVLTNGATINNIGLNIDYNLGNGSTTQTNVFTIGKTYKVQVNVDDNSTGVARIGLGLPATTLTNGLNTFYLEAVGTVIEIRNHVDFIGSITNISVKEVGQNWVLGSGWEIGDDKAVANTTGDFVNLYQNSVFVVGKTYKTTFTIVDYTQGSVRLTQGGIDVSGFQNAVGTYTAYFTATQTSLYMQGYQSFIGSITNITIIEITDDTSLPRINYEGFSYQDALGSEEVVNGGFDNGNANWSAIRGSIQSVSDEGVFTIGGTELNSLVQSNVFTVGKKYILEFYAKSQTYNTNIFTAYFGVDSVIQEQVVSSEFQKWKYVINPNQTNLQIGLYYNASYENIIFDNVSVKEYLGQSVVPDSGCGSWLFEPQTTQLVSYSEDFSQWNNAGDVTIESGYLAPDGTNNAYKVSGSDWITLPASLLTTSTRSIYARTVSGTGTAQLCSHNSNTNNTFTITEQWQRFDVTTSNSTGASSFYAVDFRGSGTLSEIILWGANATNDQDYATSYIPSNGSQVTRNQDVCTNGGSLASINSTEGVFYAEIAALANDGTNRVISISDGTTANRVSIVLGSGTNEIRGQVLSSGTSFDFSATSYNTLNNNKIAISYKLNNFSMWINGTKVSADTSGNTPVGMNTISFNAGGTILTFFGKTKALAVWKEALSDAELTELTTI